MAKKPDPESDAKFKSVVRHFLTTKPKPHTAKGKRSDESRKSKASKPSR